MIKKATHTLSYAPQFSRKYIGKHIAVVDNKIVAVGKNRLEVYKKAVKNIPRNKKVSVYYMPSKDEILTAL